MTARDDVQRVAATLERPRAGYRERFERARQGLKMGSGEIGRQLGLFSDRIGELTLDELRELYDETFGRPPLTGVGLLASRLAREPASRDDDREAVDALAPVLDRLEADRNPFSHVVRALCCVLLVRLAPSHMEQPSQ